MTLPTIRSFARRASLLAWLPFAALGAPMREAGIGLPRDLSTEGWRIDRLINLTIGLISGLFVIMVVWMLWAVFMHGRKHTAEFARGDSSKARLAKWGVALGIFFGMDGNLFVNSVHDLDEVFWNWKKVDSDPRTLKIELNAHQWAWEARSAGEDGKFNTADDLVSTSDVRVPVGTPVLFQIASTDVLHSLYIPNMRVKQDAVPGNVTRAWFEAKETGEFDIACAQHCGVAHYKMKGRLIVMAPADYDRWAREATAIAKASFDPEDNTAHWGWEWRQP